MTVFRRPIHTGFVLVALAAIFISGCGRRAARINPPVAPARIGSTETGVASWYGVPYDGRRAASGEIYDMRQLTAAHPRLPFQTWVEVTNLSNGKQVDVRINDRGPFVKGRIVDLSQAAARDIDMLRAGTARVRLKVILPPSAPPNNPPLSVTPNYPPPPSTPLNAPREPAEVTTAPTAVPLATGTPTTTDPGAVAPSATVPPIASFAVQAGAFADPARAESLRARLEDLFAEARVVPSSGRTTPLWRVIVGREMTREQAAELTVRVRRESGEAVVVAEPGPVDAAPNR
ncbi:MAG: septal ring lytic transglycosylase RlpA family protein [Acidobacteriota bacterium]